MSLRPTVVAELIRHGLEPGPDDTPATLRDRLNDVYVEEVRLLKARQRAGEIALRDYASAVEDLKRRFPLLSVPLPLWQDL